MTHVFFQQLQLEANIRLRPPPPHLDVDIAPEDRLDIPDGRMCLAFTLHDGGDTRLKGPTLDHGRRRYASSLSEPSGPLRR